MGNRTLIITWKHSILNRVLHNGSFKKGDLVYDDRKGYTARLERESFKNIKTIEAAKLILDKRDKKRMEFAMYNGENLLAK